MIFTASSRLGLSRLRAAVLRQGAVWAKPGVGKRFKSAVVPPAVQPGSFAWLAQPSVIIPLSIIGLMVSTYDTSKQSSAISGEMEGLPGLMDSKLETHTANVKLILLETKNEINAKVDNLTMKVEGLGTKMETNLAAKVDGLSKEWRASLTDKAEPRDSTEHAPKDTAA
jgi:hypothetical protein